LEWALDVFWGFGCWGMALAINQLKSRGLDKQAKALALSYFDLWLDF